jgi:hypothetical protein
MKKIQKKLVLRKDTIRTLAGDDLSRVQGGTWVGCGTIPPMTRTCQTCTVTCDSCRCTGGCTV